MVVSSQFFETTPSPNLGLIVVVQKNIGNHKHEKHRCYDKGHSRCGHNHWRFRMGLNIPCAARVGVGWAIFKSQFFQKIPYSNCIAMLFICAKYLGS